MAALRAAPRTRGSHSAGAHPPPDATRPDCARGTREYPDKEPVREARMTPLTKLLPLKCSAPSAGFARATESSGEVRKGDRLSPRLTSATGRRSTRTAAPLRVS